jgi:hypothetical protein
MRRVRVMQLNEVEEGGILIPSKGADVGGGGFVTTAVAIMDATRLECLDHVETVSAEARTSSEAMHPGVAESSSHWQWELDSGLSGMPGALSLEGSAALTHTTVGAEHHTY